MQRPRGSDPTWYGEALIRLRRQETGDIQLRIEVTGAGAVVGYLDQISNVLGKARAVRLAEGDRIACEDIEAVTLISTSSSG